LKYRYKVKIDYRLDEAKLREILSATLQQFQAVGESAHPPESADEAFDEFIEFVGRSVEEYRWMYEDGANPAAALPAEVMLRYCRKLGVRDADCEAFFFDVFEDPMLPALVKANKDRVRAKLLRIVKKYGSTGDADHDL